MKYLRAALLITAASVVVTQTARADEHDKLTKITVNEPVRLPTLVLQPGNYELKLMEDAGNRHVVEVRDDRGKGLAIILALPNYRLEPKDKTVIDYWETPAGQPRAIRAWFYPGDNYGQEFAYPKGEATQIAAYSHAPVPTVADSSTDLKTARLEETENKDLATRPAERPTTAAQVDTTPAPARPAPQVIAQATPPPSPALRRLTHLSLRPHLRQLRRPPHRTRSLRLVVIFL